MWLLHKAQRARFFFPMRSQYFNGAFASILIKVKCSPFITTNSEFSIMFKTWTYLRIPLLEPFFSSSPVKSILHQCYSTLSCSTTTTFLKEIAIYTLHIYINVLVWKKGEIGQIQRRSRCGKFLEKRCRY